MHELNITPEFQIAASGKVKSLLKTNTPQA
jgi:hypothetical protein